jgi:hypothetical protein
MRCGGEDMRVWMLILQVLILKESWVAFEWFHGWTFDAHRSTEGW